MNTSIKEFAITSKRGQEKQEPASRSVILNRDIQDRIDNLAKDNWQYSKRAIVDQLLSDALAMYGY